MSTPNLEPEDQRPVTRGELQAVIDWVRGWKRKVLILWVLGAVIAALAGYLSFKAGENSAEAVQTSSSNFQKNSQEDAYQRCVSGSELRVAIARGFDELRTFAIVGFLRGPEREAFIIRTQPAIDRLLSAASGIEYHAPYPPGSVTVDVSEEVLRLADRRCRGLVADAFGSVTEETP